MAPHVTRVSLSLLTLVPGISGGSETAREERALSSVHDYEALVSTLARRPRTVSRRSSRPATGIHDPSELASRDDECRATLIASAGGSRRRRRPLPAHRPGAAGRAPTVLTLLDVQHLDLPALFPRSERLFRRLAYDRAARRASHVVVISEWVPRYVVERLGLDPDRVPRSTWPSTTSGSRPTRPSSVSRSSTPAARPWPAQEPRAPVRGLRASARDPSELRLV